MSKPLLIEEFHVTVFARRGLPDAEYNAMRRTLDDRRFQSDLRRAIRAVVRQYHSLSKARIKLSW